MALQPSASIRSRGWIRACHHLPGQVGEDDVEKRRSADHGARQQISHATGIERLNRRIAGQALCHPVEVEDVTIDECGRRGGDEL